MKFNSKRLDWQYIFFFSTAVTIAICIMGMVTNESNLPIKILSFVLLNLIFLVFVAMEESGEYAVNPEDKNLKMLKRIDSHEVIFMFNIDTQKKVTIEVEKLKAKGYSQQKSHILKPEETDKTNQGFFILLHKKVNQIESS